MASEDRLADCGGLATTGGRNKGNCNGKIEEEIATRKAEGEIDCFVGQRGNDALLAMTIVAWGGQGQGSQ